jgi:predicted alpha/beta hydrolase family esterase
MKTAIILHGMPDRKGYNNPLNDAESNCHWLPWIQKQLTVHHILAQTPELPEPYAPDYEAWKRVFEQFLFDEETLLIGHSCGGGFLVRYLSENDIKVGKVVLVAPWLDPDKDHCPEFFNFTIKRNLVASTAGVTILVSTDDDKDILDSVEKIKSECDDVEVKEFTDKGHFTLSQMGTKEFPELLKIILN